MGSSRGTLNTVRLCGGVLFQPIYTFSERINLLADYLRSDLLSGRGAAKWPSKGFRITVADDSILFMHALHGNWYLFAKASEIYFQYEFPDENKLIETIHIQVEILDMIRQRMGVDTFSSWGVKFIVTIPVQGFTTKYDIAKAMGYSSEQLAQPEEKLSDSLSTSTFEMRYPFNVGFASLRILDAVENEILIDLDCFCVDPFAITGDYSTFAYQVFDHLNKDVSVFLEHLAVLDLSKSKTN